jgi:PAS domain S-box-containing protein
MEEALRDSEGYFKALFDGARDAILIADAGTGIIEDANKEAESLFRYPREELIGAHFSKLHPPEKREMFTRYFEKHVKKGGHPPIQTLILTGDGRPLDADLSSTVINLANGRKVTYGVFRDITERLKAEEERRKVTAERAAIIESMGDGLVKLDMDGNITETNPALERMLGYERNELIGRNILSLLTGKVNGETLQKVMSFFSTAVEGKMPSPTEIPAHTKDGRPITISFSGSFIKDPSGEPIAMVATIREVTDIVRAREELRASQRRFSHFVEGIPEGVFVVDAEGRPAYANHAFQLLIGKSIQEIERGLDDMSLLETFGAYVSGTDQPYPAERDPLVRALSGEGSTTSDMEIRWPDKDVPVEVTGAPIYDENGDILYAVAIYRNIMERKKAEEKIRASLNEKELLLKEIHHRVKNNLQIIISLLNLQSQTLADPKVQEVLKDSQERIRAMALIHEKLYKSTDLATIEFSDYVRNLVDRLLRTYAMRPGAVSLKLELEDIRLGIDEAIPCGLIVNELVTNSLVHAFLGDREGKILVTLRPEGGNMGYLVVADDGVGLPEGLDFRHTTSLGLQVVCTLVDQLDGSIELDRSKGTEFRIRFQAISHMKRL